MEPPVLTVSEYLWLSARGTRHRAWVVYTGSGACAGSFRSLDAALSFVLAWLNWWA